MGNSTQNLKHPAYNFSKQTQKYYIHIHSSLLKSCKIYVSGGIFFSLSAALFIL